MSHLAHQSFNFSIDPKPSDGTKIQLNFNPQRLLLDGFNLLAQITTASSFRKGQNPEPLNTITLMAHFDTGASVTCIDVGLAKQLNLIPTGRKIQHTGGGTHEFPTYAIDISFPNTKLNSFTDLQIGSCNLDFNSQLFSQNPFYLHNIGFLIGRDIMSRWNIVWNGPTSCVYISD